MSVTFDSAILRSYTTRMLEAIEMTPEARRDYVCWSGEFQTADGRVEEKTAMTPAQLAADLVIALRVMAQAAAGEITMTPEAMAGLKAENERVAKLPISEIAAYGRESVEIAARCVDSLTPERCREMIFFGRGERPVAVLATLILTHVVHHRGQLYMMLRSFGITPPGFM